MEFLKVMVGSIREKVSQKRMPFMTLGSYKNRQAFTSALREELDYNADEYDFRTIKIHEDMTPHGKPGEYVDHINGNTLDNRRENLRICTNRQNAQNSKAKPRKVGKTKGTKKNLACTTWSARITVNGEELYLGSYASELDAAKAYDNAAIQHFKEFARTNK